MHLKNWAVSYPNGVDAELSPMYDFVCTDRYFRQPTLALSVGGESAFERIGIAQLETLAARAAIATGRLRVVVRETIAKMNAAWPAVKARIPDDRLVQSIERTMARVPLMRGA
jgi:serine/threonine-protein kinase HipA